MTTHPIHIDGAQGGGQILRSALSLSALTGQAFVIDRIRGRRKRGGLMRQHLTAVRAAAEICGAELAGDELGSTRLAFRPGPVRPGSYGFAVGSSGSACLVLQTVLPPLSVASGPSAVRFEGGTHNPLAPPYPYLDQVVFPLWERMGVGLARKLVRAGFHPAGGGLVELGITPCPRLAPLCLLERGPERARFAVATLAHVPKHVAERELAVLAQALAIPADQLHIRTPPSEGPGNTLAVVVVHTHVTEMVVGFGEPGLRAERLAGDLAEQVQSYLDSDAVVGEHLADQLILPMAMAGEGELRTLRLTDHLRSNIEVVQAFLPVRIELDEEPRSLRVQVRPA